MPALDEQFKQPNDQVKGCESQAWLYHELIDGKHYYCADSDARMVKGFIILLVATLGHRSQQIAAFDMTATFQ